MEKSIHTRDYERALQLLRDARRNAELTQAELANRIGKTQTFVSKVERGETRLDVVQLRTVLLALGMTLTEYARKLERRFTAEE